MAKIDSLPRRGWRWSRTCELKLDMLHGGHLVAESMDLAGAEEISQFDAIQNLHQTDVGNLGARGAILSEK